MSYIDVVRAWKDKSYRDSLTADEQSALPQNPAGEIELDTIDLGKVQGANTGNHQTCACTHPDFTAGCCYTVLCNITNGAYCAFTYACVTTGE